MNLITAPWLTVLDRDGVSRAICPSQLSTDGLQDLLAPRPDFRAALFQFLIGLLQTAFAPEDEDEWLDYWRQPPTQAQLEQAFAPWAPHFELLQAQGPAFLQDLQPGTGFGVRPVRELLIDLGAVSNLHFNKPENINGLCPSCAALAVYTLQANAPKGGRGHLSSLRRDGPVTCFVLPRKAAGEATSLWQKLWLNVLPQDELTQPNSSFSGKAPKDILPWLAPTRTSEKKDGQTTPEQAHALQVYWGMPRRIRLDHANTVAGHCDLCGCQHPALLTQYGTKNYGVNYLNWLHPLTPYYHDPKKKDPPLSVKGQKGGLGYRHWLAFTLGNNDKRPDSAQIVRHFLQRRLNKLGRDFQGDVWACGFDVDNMKARCWYDATLPTFWIAPQQQQHVAAEIGQWLDIAHEASKLLHKAIKAAWADRPADMKDEPAIAQSFWQGTERLFYQQLEAVLQEGAFEPKPLIALRKAWLYGLHRKGLDLFDDWVTGEYQKDWDIERTVKARVDLDHWLRFSKPMTKLNKETKQLEAKI